MENVRIWRYPRINDCIEKTDKEFRSCCSILRDLGANKANTQTNGGVAQLGEHLPCKQGVKGSIPFISTSPKTGSEKASEKDMGS